MLETAVKTAEGMYTNLKRRLRKYSETHGKEYARQVGAVLQELIEDSPLIKPHVDSKLDGID